MGPDVEHSPLSKEKAEKSAFVVPEVGVGERAAVSIEL